MSEKKTNYKDKVKKEIISLAAAFFFIMIFRTFLFQMFVIPTGSMIPTLLVGDYLFVNKFTYGFGTHSFPFGIIPIKNRIYEQEKIKRGDVVVFFNPKDRNLDYVKRAVGIPGDKIQVKDGILNINDTPVNLEKIGSYTMNDERTNRLIIFTKYIETLPNGVKHEILKQYPMGEGPLDNTEAYFVPEDHYFMMGDNRDRSQDSRVLDKVGYVPIENVIGRVEQIFFSTSAKWYEPWNWPFGVRVDRLLKLVS